MGLSYHYSFRAPASATAESLANFLGGVEDDARLMGFEPTIVVYGPFDSPERRDFARRVARPLAVEDSRLRNAHFPEGVCWAFIREAGVCRLAPREGAVLVVTDDRGREAVFGFFRFPENVHDVEGREIIRFPEASCWSSGACIDSPDPRYRGIVRRFREAGYLADEHDEFAPASAH